MYLQNKYTKWYYNIINNAQSRTLLENIYTEKHHIIPKSLGGDNTKTNLAILTAREHYICHLLLTKMLSGNNKAKMWFAFNCMITLKNKNQTRYIPPSHTYKLLREAYNKNISGDNNPARKAMLEKPKSEAHKQAMRDNHADYNGEKNPYYGKNHSNETKTKIGNRHYPTGENHANYGRTFDHSFKSRKDHPASYAVEINGIIYGSISEASRKLDVTKTILMRLYHGRPTRNHNHLVVNKVNDYFLP